MGGWCRRCLGQGGCFGLESQKGFLQDVELLLGLMDFGCWGKMARGDMRLEAGRELLFIEGLRAKHCARHLCQVSLECSQPSLRWVLLLPFTELGTEAQSGGVNCPRSHG